MKTIVGLILARPLIAIAIAVIVVAVAYLGFTHRQTTPVTHRTERVGLTDQQQMQLGAEEYAKTLRQNPKRIVSVRPLARRTVYSRARKAFRPEAQAQWNSDACRVV